MKTGYTPDPFGHVAQMPQILRGFGLGDAIPWRGFAASRPSARGGTDGSSVPPPHLPREGYGNAMAAAAAGGQEGCCGARADRAGRRGSAGGAVLLMAGVDHTEPHPTTST
jgi:hypothetical protein